jgi:hypothetical protein
MQSEKIAEDSRLQQQLALLSGITGDGNSADGVDWGGLFDTIFGGS